MFPIVIQKDVESHHFYFNSLILKLHSFARIDFEVHFVRDCLFGLSNLTNSILNIKCKFLPLLFMCFSRKKKFRKLNLAFQINYRYFIRGQIKKTISYIISILLSFCFHFDITHYYLLVIIREKPLDRSQGFN